jgi:rRNA-processing arch domain
VHWVLSVCLSVYLPGYLSVRPSSPPPPTPCREQEIAEAEVSILRLMLMPDVVLHFMRPGRLVRVRQDVHDWGWGVLVAITRQVCLSACLSVHLSVCA